MEYLHQSAYVYIDNNFLLSHMKANIIKEAFLFSLWRAAQALCKSGAIWRKKPTEAHYTFYGFYSIISLFPQFSAQVLDECVTVHNGIHRNHTQRRKALSFTITHFSHGPKNNSYREKKLGLCRTVTLRLFLCHDHGKSQFQENRNVSKQNNKYIYVLI